MAADHVNQGAHSQHHHYVRRVSYFTHILSLLSTTVLYFLFLMYAANDFSPLFRTLHLTEKSDRPSANSHIPTSYFTLDWIMHPMSKAGTITSYNVANNMCQSSGPNLDTTIAYCDPQYWQTVQMCDLSVVTKSTKLDNIEASDVSEANAQKIIKQVLPDDGDKRDSMIEDPADTLKWANPLMKEACQIERIGNFMVHQNDVRSFSLAAGHSSDLLIAAAISTLWLVNVFQVLNYQMHHEHHRQWVGFAKLIAVLIAVLGPILLRLIVSSQHIVGGDLFQHYLPNGTYFYMLFAVFIVSYIGFRRSLFCQDCFQEDIDGHDVPMAEMPEPEKGATETTELYTGSFMSNKLRTDAYMPRMATDGTNKGASFAYQSEYAEITAKSFDFKNTAQCMEMHTESLINFELAQFFAFPLLILGIFVQYNNFELDSRLQMLFVAGIGYCIVDVFVRRLSFAVNICDALASSYNKMSSTMGIIANVSDDAKTQSQLWTKADSCKKVSTIIELLCIVLQALIACVIFFCMRWHLGSSYGYGSRQVHPLLSPYVRERMLDGTGFAFMLYVGASLLIKFVGTFFHQRFSHANLKFILLFLFVVFFNFSAWFMFFTHKTHEKGIWPSSGSMYHTRVSYFSMDNHESQLYEMGQYISGWEKLPTP